MYTLQFNSSSFIEPEYELVALHPEHFLPCGSVLPIFHSMASAPTMYVSARDQCLRKSPSPDSPRLPTFRNVTKSRDGSMRLNVFLVILNAEIRFHHYLHLISQNPPTTPLPADVFDLIHLTVELVDLLYWKPVPTKGSQGEAVFTERMKLQRDEEMDNSTKSQSNLRHNRRFALPADMDHKTRKAYGRALMSGHGMLPFHLYKFGLLALNIVM